VLEHVSCVLIDAGLELGKRCQDPFYKKGPDTFSHAQGGFAIKRYRGAAATKAREVRVKL